MFVAAYRNTERSIAEKLIVERATRRQLEREIYEARLRESQRIEEIRRLAREREESIKQEMRRRGIAYKHTYREIERRACKLFDVKPVHIRGTSRKSDIAFARHFVMYWTARLCGYSYPQMGRLMGNRDHTTLIHGVRVYPDKRAKMGRKLRAAR